MRHHAGKFFCFTSRSFRSIGNRGSVAVEFALIVPMLSLLLAGVVDTSRFLNYQEEVEQSVRAGVQYATVNPTDYSGIASVITGATALGGETGFFDSSASCGCISVASAPLTPQNCSTMTCAAPSRRYDILTARYSWSPIFGSMAFLPSPVSATIDLRVSN